MRAIALVCVLCFSVKMFGAGFTPTDAGLVANLKQGDRFMLSVWIDDNGNGVEDAGEEYFVCDYPTYTGGKFNYKSGDFVKLIPQAAGATEPSAASIWTVDTALTRITNGVNYALTAGCNINTSYTMWGNTNKTLICGDKSASNFKFLGYLSNNRNSANLCDAVFVVPTVRPTGTESMDPNGTLEANHTLNGRTRGSGTAISPAWAFDGKKGIGFGGRVYREVYWFEIPRSNYPATYTNAALVTFNTTTTTQQWSHRGGSSYDITCAPGMAAYIYADNKHKPTPRTVFRFYNLTEEIESCTDSYFFAHDEQDYVKFRTGDSRAQSPNNRMSDSTAYRKIYTNDHLHCMERDGNTKYYKTDLFKMEFADSIYYYIGKQNKYYASRDGVSLGPTSGAYSQFRKFSEMRIRGLANAATPFKPSRGAYGRVVVDTTSGAENLGATFEPAGYFLKIQETGKNIRMRPNADSTVWTCDEMWHITAAYANLHIKTTTFTGPEYSENDPGADIAGWSQFVQGTSVPVTDGRSIINCDGWARITVTDERPNGYMVFVPANGTRHINYDNNGFFGVDLPDQYPEEGKTKVAVEHARLKEGFTFLGWNTASNGSGTMYQPGDSIDLPAGETKLYAQATYDGVYNIALSFIHPTDGKRYFLSHPGTNTSPRYAHSFHYDDWTNVRQGLSNDMNNDPNHVTTYQLFEDTVTGHLPGERLFALIQDTLHGYEDSLVFNEDYYSNEDFLGLYYTTPNTILANDSWAGLFQSSNGWPDYAHPTVNNTKLFSTHYNSIDAGVSTRQERTNSSAPYIQYNAAGNQFDGVSDPASATDFQISAVVMADAHYVILPDTTDAETRWTESITFGYHESPLATRQVWSKLLGKQLMACMIVGSDTVYFHPNQNKLFDQASQLRLSPDFRLNQTFAYIRDARVESQHVVDAEDKPTMEETSNEYCRNIVCGQSSPMNVQHNGSYINIVDTLRVTLSPGGISKIKDYYGWWKTGAEGVHVRPDGSRYRDILVTTKTFHYDTLPTQYRLLPEFEFYDFPPLADHSQTLNFAVVSLTSRQLKDIDGNVLRTETINADTIKNVLDLTSATYSLAQGSTYFSIDTKTSTSVTLTTRVENELHDNRDTLSVSTQVTISGVPYDLSARVPLVQTDLTGDYMIWSVVDGGTRYFVTAGSGGLQFRQYSGIVNSRLVRNNQELIIGSANAANNNNQYLTPWASDYSDVNNQLRFWTEYGVNRRLVIDGGTVGLATYDPSDVETVPTYLTYEYVDLRSNENGNVEELVHLKYGADKWLKFNNGSPKRLELVNSEEDASVFSWTYLKNEYNLLNYGDYPSKEQEEFTYNTTRTGSIQTRYKAYREYSILLDNQMVYVAKEADELDIADLIDAEKEWKTAYTITHIRDSRMATSSGLSISTDPATLITTITQSGTSPKNVQVDGKYVNIVDTLDVALSLQEDAPNYHFKDKWSSFTSIDDAHLKIPLIRRTYYDVSYDSIVCTVDRGIYNHAFPNALRDGERTDSLYTFTLSTWRHQGTNTYDVYNELAASTIDEDPEELTDEMDLTSIAYAQVRLLDDHGKAPNWCRIEGKTKNTITVRCLTNGLRSPRVANIYIVYIVTVDGKMRFVDAHLTVSQASLFEYANNQHLVHSEGASGDTLVNGMQQTHENKRILYYYNPGNYGAANQEVELPVRERGFYGWWRWYREGNDENGVDVGDTDVPDSVWSTPPRNAYSTYNFPFRTIGDSVWVDEEDHSKGKKLVTQGRYTVFHYPSKPYQKGNPPSISPRVVPPNNKVQATYVVDISNYTDNLPLQMADVNQIDTAMLDTMTTITEPTLSLREIFELHPWTEMALRMESYKTDTAGPFTNDKYMEDHVVMAPTGNRLLLSTEQRYDYDHLQPRYDNNGKLTKPGQSESLLGYYMRDDNWSSMSSTPDEDGVTRQDTMIWCGGWDADCQWFTYNPKTDTYTPCTHTVTPDDDFLNVPAKGGLSGDYRDTVIYCLRSHSKATTTAGTALSPDPDKPEDGRYWFNICRYKIMYHNPNKYGPKLESKQQGVMKAIITNDEIEQDYEILERLDFDYNKPGEEYTVYPHPLPWADCSYGYSYPVGPEIPDNRHHNDFAPNFPGPGEYSLINRIQKTNDVGAWYQRNIEQHGGKENGYMIYCDGMSSSGQVVALSLDTTLCEGQKMFFSAYIGNSSNQTGKSNPNFTVSVQGSKNDGATWEDIVTYLTGDIAPSNNWYQIYFPLDHEKEYDQFRVRIYNMASDFDGNDFIIDDMCVFATKPPLIAYQANTKCVEQNENDSIVHVVLRVDYQGFIDDSYNNANVHYTVQQETKNHVLSFVPMLDGYLNEDRKYGADASKPDTIYGYIPMPSRDYVPTDPDSIFTNLNDLADKFEQSVTAHEADPSVPLFRTGYIREKLEGIERPVLYVVHKAKMAADNTYKVRMSLGYKGLLSSQCAMTSNLKVTNRMMLMLNGEEQVEREVDDLCGNVTYNLSLRVKGTLVVDGAAPMDQNGSCKNDWLLYGDTAEVSSVTRYGYRYSDIVKVVKDILRYEPASGESNSNQFARNLASVSRNVMGRIKDERGITFTTPGHTGDHPYDILAYLVNNGYLTLYKSDMMAAVESGDSVQYVIFPIVGTGSDDLRDQNMEICPMPIVIKLKSKEVESPVPLIIGGLDRDSTQAREPIIILADAATANSELVIPIDSINPMMGLDAIDFIETNDPNYRVGVDNLMLEPDKQLPRDIDNYYSNGHNLILQPASTNNYSMKPGYSYTFLISMRMRVGGTTIDGCPIGQIPFTVSIVPDYLRWNPQSADSKQWNDRSNWIGINSNNQVLHEEANFAPLPTTMVIIPAMTDGKPYPEMPDTTSLSSTDSVKQVGFKYNTCEAIRFLPGAAISQQQLLNYTNAIVDMPMPHNQWAFRSAPVKGMLSGDLFMADADNNPETSPWEVGEFDAHGRSHNTGNASYWLSLYSTSTYRKGNGVNTQDSTYAADAEWSKVTNGMTLSLPPAQGFAVYARTRSGSPAAVRLPKNDDIYYYYDTDGDKTEFYEHNIQATRETNAVAAGGHAGELAFTPTGSSQTYTLSKGVGSTTFVFGNPTMGYLDIWGFIADNNLVEEIGYMGANNAYTTVSKATAEATTDVISELSRYLPPMHAMLVTAKTSGTSLNVTVNTNRVLTSPEKKVRAGAPVRRAMRKYPKGIMTVTATNSVSPRCQSRLLLGQGYNDAIYEGEDALLTTLSIDNYTNNTKPATPFNLYAAEGDYGLCIDLRDSIVNIPLSFSLSNLPFDPITRLWFTGVNAISDALVLYDAATDTERPIADGIYLDIQTPEQSHEVRYYIRRRGYNAQSGTNIATGIEPAQTDNEQVVKFIKDGHVYILRRGQVYTIVGQRVQ